MMTQGLRSPGLKNVKPGNHDAYGFNAISQPNKALRELRPLGTAADDVATDRAYINSRAAMTQKAKSRWMTLDKDAATAIPEPIVDDVPVVKVEIPQNDDLQFELLRYEGVDPDILSSVKELRDRLRIEHSKSTEGNIASISSPSYISFLIQRLKLLGFSDYSHEDLMERVLTVIHRGGLTKEDTVRWVNEYKTPVRTQLSDKSLEDELGSLLSTIRGRVDTSIAVLDSMKPVDRYITAPNNVFPGLDSPGTSRHMPNIDSSILDKVDRMDYSSVGTRAPLSRDVSNDKVLTVNQLTCEVLSSFLEVDLSKIEALSMELDCKPGALTTDEAMFIVDELSLPYSVSIAEYQGSVLLKRIKQSMVTRPLVVTIMGHVDHGKTTLLDTLQNSDIVSGEAGRITQKLGAFKLNLDRGTLVFMDTPGHAAFGRMRDRGVRCADIVILVVAADDGVMPQTMEAIDLIKRDCLPCIVAVNKIDLDSGQHVRGMLAESGLDMEKIPMVYISAKHGTQIDTLLSAIFELGNTINREVDANMAGTAYVFETELHPTIGGCLRAIVRSGVIKEGGWLVCGSTCNKVKRIYDSSYRVIKAGYPSDIIQIAWSSDALHAGFFVHQRESRADAQKMVALAKRREANATISPGKLGSVDTVDKLPPEFGVVLRCGDQGGLDAVLEWISQFNKLQRDNCSIDHLIERGYINGSTKDPRQLLQNWEPIRVVSSSVGPFNRSDSQFVEVGNVAFLGFSTSIPEGILKPSLVSVHNVIYELFKDIERIFEFYFGATYVVKQEATMQVTQLGTLNLKGIGKCQAIGTTVSLGNVKINNTCMVIRDGKTLERDLRIHSMQSSRRDVTELLKGDSNNCLVFRECSTEIHIGDELVSYTKEPLPPLFGVVHNHLLDV
eukprot:XP_001608992.1 elongation factor Tu GTP binding domain containing protein [Babesia bovis T2Bo]